MYSPQAYSDIQGDMARHDEEGSGGYRDDIDDDEYNSIVGSGDGSGDGKHLLFFILPILQIKYSFSFRFNIIIVSATIYKQ